MDYLTLALVALIALAIVLLVLFVIGHNYIPWLNKFLGEGV